MAAEGGKVPGPRNRRAASACEFCRRKKLKCDNGQPKCHNCVTHGSVCVHIPHAKKPRPSQERILHLEEENRRLRETSLQLNSQILSKQERRQSTTTDPHPLSGSFVPYATYENSHLDASFPILLTVARHSPSSVSLPTTFKTSSIRSSLTRVALSADKQSRYHGPTSAMFDELSSVGGVRERASTTPKVTREWAQCLLLAEAAKQHQSESINFARGKLDFDGVDPDLGMHLLSIYWSRQHHSGLITYRPAFMRDMACGGPYFSKLLLNAIYFGASKHSPRLEIRRDPNDITTAGWSYRQRAMELLSTAFDKSEITTVQALLIMASSLFSRCDERSVSWLYAGNAFNMIIDLGIQVDVFTIPAMSSLSEEDLEIRRRVFWGAYVIDKIQSLYQGRPASLREADSCVPMTFLDEYEELEQFNPISYTDTSHPGTPLYNISFLRELCKLSIIMDRILSSLYAERSTRRNPNDLSEESRSLNLDLEQWRKALSPRMDFKHSGSANVAPLPHMLSLMAMFNVLVILVHRPLVSDGHLQSTSPSIVFDSFVKCESAATEITQILDAYGKVFDMRSAPYLISYATYVSATIHVRIAAQKGPGSDAYSALQTCLDALDQHQHLYSAASRAKHVVHILMSSMGVVVGNEESCVADIQQIDRPWENMQITAQDDLATSRSPTTCNAEGREPHTQQSITADDVPGFDVPDFDIDAVVQSFILEQQMVEQYSYPQQFLTLWDPSSNVMLPA